MTDITLEITAWYSDSGMFESYQVDTFLDGALRASDPGDGIRDLVDRLTALFQHLPLLDGKSITDGARVIRLIDGPHPLTKCRHGCNHIRYTAKPEDDFIKRLPVLLSDSYSFEK